MESEAIFIVTEILKTLNYLHRFNLVHRDLKPENIIYDSESKSIKIIDFGLSSYFTNEGKLNSKVGTPYYVAPEVLKGEYSKECDMWSVGVITYILMTGFPPFNGKTNNEIYRSILTCDVTFYAEEWGDCLQAMDFVKKLLRLRPERRYSAEQALKHPWVASALQDKRKKIQISGEVLGRLRNFRRVDCLKKEIILVLINFIHKESENLSKVKETFEKLDEDHTGFVDVMKMKEILPELVTEW